MKKLKVLFWDIETSPNISYTWGRWQQDVIAFKKEWELLSVAYKWQGSTKVHCLSRPQYKDETDAELCSAVHEVLSKADVLVAHNGDSFDLKKVCARFAAHSLPPLPPLATVDTKKIAKKHFAFNSNSLDDLGKLFGLGKKLKHSGFDMWLGCMAGSAPAWKEMVKYNKLDVVLLEKIYLHMRPWMLRHPANLTRTDKCTKCRSSDVMKWGIRVTLGKPQQRWACKSCGGYFLTVLKKEVK
jgi:uncharacterized protein YprB with RNaseH-like and TPR domain